MGVINEGANGGFSGKVGSMIGYKIYGKWIIKGLPKPSRKNQIGTAKQKACRSGFAKMQHFLSPLVYLIQVGFGLEAKKKMMNSFNACKSYNMLYAQNADGEIDYSKVCLSYGSMLGVEDPEFAVDDAGVHFTWTNNTGIDHPRYYDQVMIAVYDVEHKFAVVVKSGAMRSVGQQTVVVPERKPGRTFHMWISFVSDDRTSVATSTYMGSFVC